MDINIVKKKKRHSLNIIKDRNFEIFNSLKNNIKILPLEDFRKSEKKNDDKKTPKNISKKQLIIMNLTSPMRKTLNFFTKIQSKFNKNEIEFLIPFQKMINQKLKDKYNYKYKEIFHFMKKEEIPTQYDYNQLTYLIEKKRSRIFSQLNELFFLNNIQEFLKDIYNRKQSIIILKYLLFFIYDKDIMTYIDKDNEKQKKYIKSNFERFIEILKAKNEARTIIGNNKEIINKYIKFDESIFFNFEKINNNIFISYDFSKVKYLYIYNVPVSRIYNCIPNIFPNGLKITNILKDFLNKRKTQKLLNNKIYFFKKNSMNDSNKSKEKYSLNSQNKKKSIKNNNNTKFIFDMSSYLSSEEKKNYFNGNNYSMHYHSNSNTRREKNDEDIIDIEKIINNLSGNKYKDLLYFNEEYNKTNSKIFKKPSYSKNYRVFPPKNNNVNKFTHKNEKILLSENSTSLSNKYKVEKKDNNIGFIKEKINISPYSFSRKIFFKKDNYLKDNFKSKKDINIKKNLILSSKRYENKKYSSLKKIQFKQNILLSPIKSQNNIKYKKLDIKRKYIKEIKKKIDNYNKSNKELDSSNKIIKENKYIFKKTNEFLLNKKYHKIIKNKYTKLKDFLKIKLDKKYSKINSKNEIKNYNSFSKGFEFIPEIFFLKNKNINVWESGEDITAQKQCEDFTKHIMNNIKKNILRNKKTLKNSSTFKQIIKYGNIYENNFSII